MPVIQQQGVDLKEHFDRMGELKEDIHKLDMQIIEELFRGGCGWDVLSRMLESSLLAGTHTLNVNWGSGVGAHDCNLIRTPPSIRYFTPPPSPLACVRTMRSRCPAWWGLLLVRGFEDGALCR